MNMNVIMRTPQRAPYTAGCARTRRSSVGAGLIFLSVTVEGDRGVLAWLRLKNEALDAEQQLAKVTSQRLDLEHRVLLLHPDHLDPDMLEERARVMLNMGREDEVVVLDRRR